MSTTSLLGRRCIIVTQMKELGYSGNQIHALAVFKYLQAQGCDVSLVTPFSGPSLSRPLVFGVRYLLRYVSGNLDVLWLRQGHSFYLEAALKRALQIDTRPVVIYAQDPLSAASALKLKRSALDSVALVVHFNGSQADEWVLSGHIKKGKWLYRNIAGLEHMILPAVDKIIFVSEYMKQILETRIPELKSRDTVVIHNFVEESMVSSKKPKRDIIAIGTLEPRKNQQYILRVIAELRSRGLVLSATIVGDGADRAKLQMLAVALGIAQQVVFTGSVHNAADLIPSHRLLVHASLTENCPISLIEALAAGTPIVAARVGGIPEIVDHSTGRFWNLDSVSDGADVIADLLANAGDCEAHYQACKKKYSDFFSPATAGQRLMATLGLACD